MKRKNWHIGGVQLPMFLPETSWTAPTELPDLRQVREFAIDTETKDEGLRAGRGPGWAYRAGYITGFSLAYGNVGEEKSVYIPIAEQETTNFDRDAVQRWLNDHRHVRWIMQNAPYDLGWFRSEFDLKCPNYIDDTTAMSVLLDENELSYKLDDIAARCGIAGKNETLLREAAIAFGFDAKSEMWRIPARFKATYAEGDALATLRAARHMRPKLIEESTYGAYELEMDLIPLIQEMRWRGIKIDLERAEAAKTELLKRRDTAFEELRKLLGERVGMEEIGKTSWLERVFNLNKISFPRTAPTSRFPNGQPSFTAGVLGWMHKHPHWLPRLIVQADRYNNAATKYIQGFIVDYAHKGRVHASINQFMSDDDSGKRGTRSHRFSYSDPALQQMPSRDPELKDFIRGCFVPEPEELWGRIDYEQQEYRLIVHFAKRLGLSKANIAAQKYIDDPATDFHALVAELTGLDRTSAKQVNFAKAYGAGKDKFANLTSMPVAEAEAVMRQYDEEMPFVLELNDRCKNLASRRGWIKLIDGARLHYPFWEGPWLSYEERSVAIQHGFNLNPCRMADALARQKIEGHPWSGKLLRRADVRKAMNGLIQGSAARQTKLAMRDCWRAGLVPLLQIHDELNFSCSDKQQGDKAAEIMRDAVKLEIPVGADCEWGVSWARAAKNKTTGYKATWAEAQAELAG
ncbi:MAG TPA: DNA polymerase [Candidatus Saccharimonadia bacterium]|nr:DNA polymerase [Candidatus Saccharimonadia bacterium]